MSMNQLKTALLLGFLAGLFLIVGYLMGGYQGMTIGLVFAIGINFGMYFFSHKLVLKMYRAKEADEKNYRDLIDIVREVSHLANVPMPKVYIVPSQNPNAFATGPNPNKAVVACTNGILGLLTKDELRGVIAHEIAHIKNRDMLVTTVAATIAAVISYVGFMARWAGIFGGFGREGKGSNLLELLILGILTPLIAVMLQLAISRSREYLADATGSKFTHNPLALASALQKLHIGAKTSPMKFGNETTSSLFIVNPFSGKGIMHLLSTHPPMEERIKRLKKMV